MKFAVVVFPGSNCDHDAYHAAKHVLGQDAEFVWHKDTSLRGADAVILPGGFAHGDYLRTGAIARFSPIMPRGEALCRRRRPGARHLQRLPGAARGGPAAGRDAAQPQPEVPVRARLRQGRADRHAVHVACRPGQVLRIPIAHGEGNYYAEPDVVERLERNRQVVFRYTTADGAVTPEANPNGSVNNIAGTLQRGAQRRRPDAASRARLRAGRRQRRRPGRSFESVGEGRDGQGAFADRRDDASIRRRGPRAARPHARGVPAHRRDARPRADASPSSASSR